MNRPNHPSGKDLLGADSVSLADLEDVFRRADRFWDQLNGKEEDDTEDDWRRFRRRPKVVATLFDQRSTRTRLGFQAAAARLGHQALDVYDTERSRMGTATGESVEDHIRTIEAYTDLIVVRSHLEDLPYKVARLSHLPVVNAGNGAEEHPTQALIDIYSIRKMRGDPRGLSIALSSDTRARFAVSFVKMLHLMPPKRFTLCTMPDVTINPVMREAVERLASLGTEISHVHNVKDTLDHDVLSIQMQDMSKFAHASLGSEAVDKERETEPFSITAQKILAAKSDILLLNPLPRFSELDTSCDELPNAGYFRQVEYSNPVRMAVLDRMLTGVPWTGSTITARALQN